MLLFAYNRPFGTPMHSHTIIFYSFFPPCFNVQFSLQLRAKKSLDAANNELEINLDNALKVRGASVFSVLF